MLEKAFILLHNDRYNSEHKKLLVGSVLEDEVSVALSSASTPTDRWAAAIATMAFEDLRKPMMPQSPLSAARIKSLPGRTGDAECLKIHLKEPVKLHGLLKGKNQGRQPPHSRRILGHVPK